MSGLLLLFWWVETRLGKCEEKEVLHQSFMWREVAWYKKKLEMQHRSQMEVYHRHDSECQGIYISP